MMTTGLLPFPRLPESGRLWKSAGLGLVLLVLAGSPLAPGEETPWHEPGGVLHAAFLRHGKLRYGAEGREIVGQNRTYFNNRPLYCELSTAGVVLTGDRPFVRFGVTPYVYGGFSAAIVRGGAGRWFHEYSQVESRYRCGRMRWRISDSALPGLEVTLDAVPRQDPPGFALRLRAQGERAGDQLIWAFGGAHGDPYVRSTWDPLTHGVQNGKFANPFNPPQYKLAMDAERCRGNRVLIEGPVFRLLPMEGAAHAAFGRADRAGKLFAADASAYGSPGALAKSAADKLPLACGVMGLRAGGDEVFWAIEAAPAKAAANTLQIALPAKAFRDGLAYLESTERVQVETPDPRLDAAVAAVCHAIDAHWDRSPTIPRGACMAYSREYFLNAWRCYYGTTALGWHDRVMGACAYYLPFQVKPGDSRTQPESDPERLHCVEGSRSRFFGAGHIDKNQYMYNLQTQFFDQLIRDWRWTADPQLEQMLRPALELQLQWAKDCFDPDGDGLYESYIDTMPTDNVWYNGGGSVEESAYACYARRAAMEMARRAGDTQAAARHQAEAEKIQRALRKVLWLKDRGHFGLYTEQGGHHRVHSDAWLSSEFLPIDAGIATSEEALQALYYTEWGLERIRFAFGGEICQPSNWVPSVWSVRDLFNGDTWHLALAYSQSGLGDEGWELLLGAMLETAYASVVPGGFSQVGAATDLADSSEMFARAVVEGLFGYDPDYPNGLVRMRPAFPSSWPEASIRTPDFSFQYRQEGDRDTYHVALARPAAVDFRLPVRAVKVRRVTRSGREVSWKAEPGFGCTWVRLKAQECSKAEVIIETCGRVSQAAAVLVAGEVGGDVRLPAPRGQIVHWQDCHGVIENARAVGSEIRGRLACKPGHHLVLADLKVGELPQRQVFKVQVTDPEGEARLAAKTPREAPKGASWACLDLAPQYNGDVRAIFKQRYLAPRSKTCSVRLGVDGYSGWCFPFWKIPVPAVDLTNLERLSDGRGRILTPQNVPFARLGGAKNIAFTSLWHNWPRLVTVPVNKEADAVWLLVCGSTFPMQTRIANAEIRFRYADGQAEKLELVPPLNLWSLCPWGADSWAAVDYRREGTTVDYSYESDAFCLPKQPPPSVSLGKNCRAMVLAWKLRPRVQLRDVTLETLSQDVVIGLMGVSLMNPR